jgi:hypothetical protein
MKDTNTTNNKSRDHCNKEFSKVPCFEVTMNRIINQAICT